MPVAVATSMHWDGFVSMSGSSAVGCGFTHRLGNTKDLHKVGTNCLSAWHPGIRVGIWQCNPTE